MEQGHPDVQEVGTMEQITHHLNVMTNRVLNAEIALDIALGILFEDNDSYQKKFEDKFEVRIKELNEARDAAMAKAQEAQPIAESMTVEQQSASPITSSATAEPSRIITP